MKASGIEVRAGRGAAPSRREVEETLVAEGLTPHAWGNAAGYAYASHAHQHHKVLVCVRGSIVFHVAAGDVALGPGDRMELPGGVDHGATVGAGGVECVEAYRH